jgi:VWFA-related protein
MRMAGEFRYPRRVQFAETDLAGIVHFSTMFRYIEEAEHALWREAGLTIVDRGSGRSTPRCSTGCEACKPLDMSSSLSAERLAALRAASASLLSALEDDDRAALATFSHEVRRGQALTSDLSLVRRALERARPAGATSLIDAMYAAIAMTEPGDRRSLLIVFSDGIDTTSWLGPEVVMRAAQRSDTVVYAVSTAETWQTPALLRDVTAATGGKLLAVDSASLTKAFTQVLNEFRHRYVLSYTLPGAPSPGWHRLDVRVKGRGAAVQARAGYQVGPQ